MVKVELSGSFLARDESGRQHTVRVYHPFRGAGAEGVLSLKMAGGRSVERVSKGVYRTADARVLMRSADPAAP